MRSATFEVALSFSNDGNQPASAGFLFLPHGRA